MASRYWVGGTGNWDAATTTHWSTSSGGAGGASVPTSADDVFIDANSGASPVITLTATANCLSINFTGSVTPTFALSTFTINVSGDWTSVSGVVISAGTSTISMNGASKTFAGAGRTYNNITFIGSSSTISGTNTFNIVTIAAGSVLNITSGTAQTLTNIVSNGIKGNRATIQASTAASAASIFTTSNISASHLTVQDITKAGTGSITFRSSLPVSGNSGIIFLDRYWIGGTGNTSDTAHWAYVNGGAGSAGVPTSTDSVYFDSASFSGAGQIVTVDAAFNCLDMDWTGATNSPTLAGSSTSSVYGNLTMISAMTLSYTGQINMQSITTGKTITTAGKTFLGFLGLQGIGGGWTLQDSFTSNSSLVLNGGTFDTNSKTLSFVDFTSNNSNVRSLILGASLITLSGVWTCTTTTNFTLNAGTSTITMTGATKTFSGGGLTYYNVSFAGTPTTISGSNTFNTLTLATGKTLKLTSGTTQTVTSLVCNGTTAAPSTLQSVTAASPATIAVPAGRYFIRHTSIKDIAVSGATAVTSIAGTNVSGNTGITFVTKFEMGRIKNDGSFNWYNTSTGLVTKVSG